MFVRAGVSEIMYNFSCTAVIKKLVLKFVICKSTEDTSLSADEARQVYEQN